MSSFAAAATYIPLAELMSAPADGSRIVCRGRGEAIDLARLRADVAHNAARLRKRVAAGDATLLTCADSYWFVVGLWAALYAGARVVLPPNVQTGTLAEFRATTALTIGDADQDGAQDMFRCEASDRDEHLTPLLPAACRIDFFSSGSTGKPKCIAKTLDQIEREIQILEASWGEEMGGSAVSMTVSHLHVYGLTYGVLWPMAAGRPFDTETYSFWEPLFAHLDPQGTIVTSPAHLCRIPESVDYGAISPAVIFSAAAPLPWDAARRTRHVFGCWPVEIYGSTETGSIAYRRRTEPDPAWRPCDGVTVRLSERGQLSIRSVFLRDDAWRELDDLVTFETPETFRLGGRADRIVKIEGKRVALPEVEARIRALEDFDDATAIVVDVPSAVIAVVAVLSETGREHRDKLGRFRFSRDVNARLRRYLESAALPKRWRYVDRIPVNEQGKRVAASLKALFEKRPETDRTTPQVLAVREADSTFEIDMYIREDLLYFQGHFPDFPVLPGIVQLDWAVHEARGRFGRNAAVGEVQKLKFRKLIPPETAITLSLNLQSGKRRVAFEYRGGGDIYSSGQFTFAAA